MTARARRLAQPVSRPRCDAVVQETAAHDRWRRGSGGIECQCLATYAIEGKNLCARHAQAKALEILLKGDAT